MFKAAGDKFTVLFGSCFYIGNQLWTGWPTLLCKKENIYLHRLYEDSNRTDTVGSSNKRFVCHEIYRAILGPDVGARIAYPDKKSDGPLTDRRKGVNGRRIGYANRKDEVKQNLLRTDIAVSQQTVVTLFRDELFPGRPFDGQAISRLMTVLRKPVSKGGMGLHQPHRPAETERQTATIAPACYEALNRVLAEVWKQGGREAMDAYLAEWNQGVGGVYFTRQHYKLLSNLDGEEDPNVPPYFKIEYHESTLRNRAKKMKKKQREDS